MRRAIEKLTFLLISFAAASLVSFTLLARLVDHGHAAPAALPLLLNLTPHDARDLTLAAVRTVAHGGGDANAAERELARLGGAALPHVLPFLESLDPGPRGRVALALRPIARRMGVAADDDLDTAERAVVFFTRFWQDRSADFRAQAVRRKVQRLAERALPLRRKEVVELDTFALPELLDALGRVQSDEDVKRVERLVPVLAHVSGVSLVLPPNPSLAQAAEVVAAWRDWGFDHGSDFVTLDGPGRLAAMVFETRYFRFLASMPRAFSHDDPAGAERLRRVFAGAERTVPVVFSVLAVATLLAVLVARFREQHFAYSLKTTFVASALGALPLSALAVRSASAGVVVVGAALALGLAALLVLELEGPSPAPAWQRALGRAGHLLPLALSAELAAEAFERRGLGELARTALADHDLDTVMWIALALSATSSLALLLPDARFSDDEAGPPVSELVPGVRGRAAPLAVGVITGLMLALAALQPSANGVAGALGPAARYTLVSIVVVTAVAVAIVVVFGLFLAGLSRTADSLLARTAELSLVLPQPLVAACAFAMGWPGLGLLGAVRGLEVASVLRKRLAEQRATLEIGPPSLGRAPLSPYFRRVLPPVLAPVAATLVMSGAWVTSLEGACSRLGAPPAVSLGALAVGSGTPSNLALLLVAVFVGAWCWLVWALVPHAEKAETSVPNLVVPLKRRIDSMPPPDLDGGSDRGSEP
jgi:hypothetical protein